MTEDKTATPGNTDTPEGEDPKEGPAVAEAKPQAPQGPSDDDILERHKRGELLTKERVNEIFQERLARWEESKKAEQEEERRKTAEQARTKALKDQENYKELSETQATQLAEKNTEISQLQEKVKRIAVLEDRLGDVVDSQLEGLEPAWKSLLQKMTVEERAEWIKQNPDLVGKGTPEGSPATPPPADRNRRRRAENDQTYREQQRFAAHSRL